MCVCETKVERDFVRAPEVRWSLDFMHESAETGFRGFLETASQTGDAVEIVPLTSCGSCGGLAQCWSTWPAGSLGARACAADASVGAKGARCARPELETGSDPITQMECLAGDGW